MSEALQVFEPNQTLNQSIGQDEILTCDDKMKSQGITKEITIYSEGGTWMSVPDHHGNPSSSCQDISLKTTNVRGSSKSLGYTIGVCKCLSKIWCQFL